MAILTQQPSFEVTVEVNGHALQEYNFVQRADGASPDANSDDNVQGAPVANRPSPTKVVNYIEAPLSGEFTIRYTCKPGFSHSSDRIYADISLDGKTIFIPDLHFSPCNSMDSQVCYGGEIWRDGGMLSQKFMFNELIVGM